MEIIEFFKSDNKDHWLGEIRKSDWKAAVFLADLIENNLFYEKLGKGTLLLLTENEKLISFLTMTERDCIDDKEKFPWIGFVYTFPEYRGRRCSGKLIDCCEKIAAKNNVPTLFVCTDHIGLYEKYGFSYMENRIDIYGTDSRVYLKHIT